MPTTRAPALTRPLGFSTGSLALGDFAAALASLKASDASAVELSALREAELAPLMAALPELDLGQFHHVSVHAPSALISFDEAGVITALKPAIDAQLAIIVHADVIRTYRTWRELGALLHIENMDKRKVTGRTASELRPLLEALPNARLCLDLAHARQIDPSLCETVTLLDEFGDRLGQIHLSELNAKSRHESLSHAAVAAFRSLSRLIPPCTPVILEFDARPSELNGHLQLARRVLHAEPVLVRNIG